MTKTTAFIRPLLKIPSSSFSRNGYIDAYLGHYEKTGEEWGSSIYLAFNKDLLGEPLVTYMLNKDNYLSNDIDGDVHLFEFKISPSDQENIIMPFLKGAYSKVDRRYVDENFPKITFSGSAMNVNPKWKVFYKDPSLAKYWEDKIGIKFTNKMEVYSKPLKNEEIYGYPIHISELLESDVSSGATYAAGHTANTDDTSGTNSQTGSNPGGV